MKRIQEKIIGSFTEKDWEDIKAEIKEIIVDDFRVAIEDQYIFTPSDVYDFIRDFMEDFVETEVKGMIEDQRPDLEKIIRKVLIEELRGEK